MIIPLLKNLGRRSDVQCVTLGLTTAGAQLAAHGFQSRGFASLVRPIEDRQAVIHGERLAKALPENGAISHEESVAYLGLSYADLEQRLGAREAAEAFAKKGRQAFMPLGPMRRLFDEVEPDLVVTTISPRAEEAALAVARERGIRSLCLVDLFARPSLRRAAQPGYGTRVCVISEDVRRWLLSAGRRDDEVVVTGNPAFDHLARPELVEAGRALRRLRGWNGRKVILWASQVEPEYNAFSGNTGNPELPALIEQALLKLMSHHQDWQLVIRPHPNETPRRADRLLPAELSDQDDNLHELLAAVDLVVIMTSTVGLEARLLGRPVISVDLSIFSADTPFAEAGFSRGIVDLRHLESAIESGLAEDARLPEGVPAPGGATKAVLTEIDNLLTVGGE